MKKIAVILANLGGPDSLDAVEPFLFNLFYDKAIITLPNPLRWLIAKLISKRRTPVAKKIYEQLGGKSPILDLTREQATELEALLNSNNDITAKVFVVMRHWKPFSRDVVKEINAYAPDEMLFLPLYPQFSTTMTGSSIADWIKKIKAYELPPCKFICCYPMEPLFIQSHIDLIMSTYREAKQLGTPRILFSAHGLPEKIVLNGDPYQWQVEQTVAALVKGLKMDDLDWRICYQSRVGPMEWLKPSTETEIIRAGEEKIPLIVVPVTFVSEHSETLVELDIEYKKLAKKHGIDHYFRVPALATNSHFIESLRHLCEEMIKQPADKKNIIQSSGGKKICPKAFSGCIHNIC